MGLVGFSLFSTIKGQISVASVNMTSNMVSPATITLLNITPYFFIGVVVLSVMASLIPDLFPSEDYREEYDEQPTHKQTYEEYVRERLKVERMMRYGWIGRYL